VEPSENICRVESSPARVESSRAESSRIFFDSFRSLVSTETSLPGFNVRKGVLIVFQHLSFLSVPPILVAKKNYNSNLDVVARVSMKSFISYQSSNHTALFCTYTKATGVK
jgi:hypothetical protein